MARDHRKRFPEVISREPEIRAYKDHLTAIFWIDENKSIGVRFISVDNLMMFVTLLVTKAALVWPDDPTLQELSKEP